MISLCMIVKNEEMFLETCLESVKDIVSEIIIVDTGSTDKTLEIASKFNARIFHLDWKNDFSAARNFSLDKATQPWILVLDADEVLEKSSHSPIREFIQKQEFLAYSFMQITYTNNEDTENFVPITQDYLNKGFKGYVICKIVRLFKNDKDFRFVGPVHEYIEDSILEKGPIGITNIPIHHYQELKGPDFFRKKQLDYLKIYEENLASYPNKARAYRHLGNLYYTFLQDYDKAVEYFYKSIELKQDDRSYLGLGWCYLKQNKLSEAEEAFKKGLEVNRRNPTLWASRGKLYILMRKPKAALTCFQNVLKLGNNPQVENMVRDLKEKLGV